MSDETRTAVGELIAELTTAASGGMSRVEVHPDLLRRAANSLALAALPVATAGPDLRWLSHDPDCAFLRGYGMDGETPIAPFRESCSCGLEAALRGAAAQADGGEPGLTAGDWDAIEGCLTACAHDPREKSNYAEWYEEVLTKVRARRAAQPA